MRHKSEIDSSKQLDDMVGKLFLYNQEQVKLLRWSFTADRFSLTFDLYDMKVDFGDIKERLKEFLPIEDEQPSSLVVSSNANEMMVSKASSFGGEIISKLRDTLLDNIEKVKTNKEYIPQAQEIKAQVDSIIDLAKTEIDMAKTMHIISGKR